MHIDLTDRVAIVTGAGRGIGRDIALRLVDEGVKTVGLDVRELGPEFDGINCDITDSDQINEVVESVAQRYGRIDIVVNNAGVSKGAPLESLSEEVWRACHDVNLTGTFLMCKAVTPIMKKQRSGRIINAASFAAIVPTAGGAAYASSKAAVAHFTRAIAGELGPWGITANAYAPGMIPTEMNHFAERPADVQERLLDLLTIRRWGSTEDVANLICFLASDQAAYITGTLIDVSGGKLATQLPGSVHERAAAEDPALTAR
jgi:3-oxoacyl-[acyl-carrier protein] reductase